MKGRTYRSFLLARLLLRDVSVFQLMIYALGVFMGLFIIIVAFQFVRDIRAGSSVTGTDATTDYIVLSKHVKGIGLSSSSSNVTRSELEALESQDWVVKAAPFSPARFNVTVSVELGGASMSSALFFESVPDEFFDSLPDNWTFNPEDPAAVVPIVLPRDYLALYNFGFAASRGLPRIGEDVMMTIPLRISVSGNGKQRYVAARVAGFTSRLNTIAVPATFIDWGNENFRDPRQKSPSRIIAEINRPASDAEVQSFLKAHSLELNGDKGLMESSGNILATISTVIIAVGLLIALLSVALLFISIFLLIHKTRAVVYRLLALGYRPVGICCVYTSLFGILNILVLALALTGLFVIKTKLSVLLSEAGYPDQASVGPTVLLAVALVAIVTILCHLIFLRSTSLKRFSR